MCTLLKGNHAYMIDVFSTFLSPLVKCVKSVPTYFAECVYESMKVNIFSLCSLKGAAEMKKCHVELY